MKLNDSKYLLQDEKYMSDLLSSKERFVNRILNLHEEINKLKDEPEVQWINRLECAYRKQEPILPKAKSPHENVIYVEFKNERIKV